MRTSRSPSRQRERRWSEWWGGRVWGVFPWRGWGQWCALRDRRWIYRSCWATPTVHWYAFPSCLNNKTKDEVSKERERVRHEHVNTRSKGRPIRWHTAELDKETTKGYFESCATITLISLALSFCLVVCWLFLVSCFDGCKSTATRWGPPFSFPLFLLSSWIDWLIHSFIPGLEAIALFIPSLPLSCSPLLHRICYIEHTYMCLRLHVCLCEPKTVHANTQNHMVYAMCMINLTFPHTKIKIKKRAGKRNLKEQWTYQCRRGHQPWMHKTHPPTPSSPRDWVAKSHSQSPPRSRQCWVLGRFVWTRTASPD